MQLGLKDEYQLIQLCKLSQSKKIMLPSDWQINQLKDVVQINPETINESYDQKEIQYIDISSIENYQIKKYEHFSLEDRPSRAQRIVRKGDIVVSTVRPYLRGFAKICDAQSNLVCSTGFAVLRPKTPEDSEFIFNYIKSDHFQVNIVRHMEGMAYPAVTSRIVGNSLVPWPSKIYERINIGRTLSRVDGLIQKTDQVIEQTQKLKKGLMQRLLTKGIAHIRFKAVNFGGQITESIPTSWKEISLEELSENGTQNGIAISITDYGKGIPIVGMTDLFENDTLNYSSLREVSITKDIDKFSLKKGDLMFARRSLNVEGAGKCVLVPKVSYPMVFESSIIRVTMNASRVIPEYAHYVLNSFLGRRIMTRIVRVVAVSGITGNDLRKVRIPIPEDLKEQQKIISFLSSVDLQIQIQYQHKSHLANLKKGLMQKLLTGKNRVKV